MLVKIDICVARTPGHSWSPDWTKLVKSPRFQNTTFAQSQYLVGMGQMLPFLI